jgi:hypothetical protein
MRARTVLLTALFVAGCGGGGAAATNQPVASQGQPSGGAVPTLAGGQPASTDVTASPGGNGQPGSIRASGAKIRVVNLYNDGSAAPGPIDVYGDFQANGAPLMSVAYGTASDWFDPGILDDQRNAEITFFPAGKHTQADLLIDQGETLKGTERITMIVGTGDSKKADGTSFGQLEVEFENSTLNPLPTPHANQSLVEVDALSLDTWPGAGSTAPDGYMYLSVGAGCLKNVGNEDDNTVGVQPLSAHRGSAQFSIPAGAQKLSLHPSDACTDTSPYPSIAVDIAAGQSARLLLYSANGKDLNTLVVPFGG